MVSTSVRPPATVGATELHRAVRGPPKLQLGFKGLHAPRKRGALSSVSPEAFRMQDSKMRLTHLMSILFSITLRRRSEYRALSIDGVIALGT